MSKRPATKTEKHKKKMVDVEKLRDIKIRLKRVERKVEKLERRAK